MHSTLTHTVKFEQAPEWFLNAFGLVWLIWTVSEVAAAAVVWKNRGEVRRGTLDRIKMYTYVIVTIFWWCWRIYG